MEVQNGNGIPRIVIFPCVGVGHFIPAIELTKRLCLNHGISATVITSKWMRAAKQVAYAQYLAKNLPGSMLDRDSQAFRWFLQHCSRLPKASGILINTFEEMEKEALEALREGKVLSSSATPSIYSIGPVISEGHETHECPEWLDQQPPSSVVYVSFRSGSFLWREQIGEVAHGLETSGHRFLWVVRGENYWS